MPSFGNSPMAQPEAQGWATLPSTRAHPAPISSDSRFENSSTFDEYIDPILPKIVTLLNYNLHLTQLTIPFPEVKTDDPVLAAIASLKHLQSFTVYSCSSSSQVGTLTVSSLLQAYLPLPKLAELYINLKISWSSKHDGVENFEVKGMGVFDNKGTGGLSLDTIVKEAAIARFSQIPTPGKIKLLQLPVAPELSGNPLALPLLKSGLLDLESSNIFSFTKDLQPNDVERIVREHCPNLRRITCPSYVDLVDGQLARAFLRGCSGLQSFSSEGFQDRISDDYDNDRTFESRFIVPELVSYHCDTLEDFELEDCRQVFVGDLQAILSRCKRLKRYHVTGDYLRGMYRRYHEAGLDLTDELEGDWICTELRERCITLDRTTDDSSKRFYTQIGQLPKLERLTFYISGGITDWEYLDFRFDLTLSRGWLGEMAGLKNLKSFALDTQYWPTGQAEVEFMHEHWPQLREISFVGGDASWMRAKPHWQWHLDKRPYLHYNTR